MKDIDNTEKIKNMAFETPMMQQYARIKKEYPDTLLFFRLGDFYELFLEDAEIGARILDITLTARNKGKDGKIPMCGVPFHAIDSYLGKIVKAGYKAAICEQVTKPEKGKNIVEREVVRIVTPGTVTDDGILDRKANNFVLALNYTDNLNQQNLPGNHTANYSSGVVAFSYVDISTGDFYVLKKNYKGKDELFRIISNEVKRISPSEILLDRSLYENSELLQLLRDSGQTNIFTHLDSSLSSNAIDQVNYIRGFFDVVSLDVYAIDNDDVEMIDTIYFLLNYLDYTQKSNISHINKIINTTKVKYMRLDSEAIRNLEIFQSNQIGIAKRKDNSLFSVIDYSKTALGSRLLRNWLLYPLIDKSKINKRLSSVEWFLNHRKEKDEVTSTLEHIIDIERTFAKVGVKTANARDLVYLSNSLEKSLDVIKVVENQKTVLSVLELENSTLKNIKDEIKVVIDKINTTIVDEPPLTVREGKMIKKGVNQELDDIKASIEDSKKWIAELEAKERERTGIAKLKVGYNSVFGYYIEVTKANSHLVPDDYIRKQTLVNAERYITEELKYREQIVLNAEEKINEIEYEIFMDLLDEILNWKDSIQAVAKIIAVIDVLSGFANLSLDRNYVKPNIFEPEKFDTKLTESRHPVVETVLQTGEFTPNNCELTKKKYIHLITGPNMAGKSTYIRQVALIQLLAQIGSFVPAYSAEISIVDGIYTRIGAGDALAQGLSTFMVEMIETAKILNNATKHSLVVLDEVGRGTSTIDGLSIAQAVTEYLHNTVGCKTLFATHFHELTQLDLRLKHLDNYHVSILDKDGEIKFLHKVEKGGTDKSYGIEVAKLAGVPDEVISRAKEILSKSQREQLGFGL